MFSSTTISYAHVKTIIFYVAFLYVDSQSEYSTCFERHKDNITNTGTVFLNRDAGTPPPPRGHFLYWGRGERCGAVAMGLGIHGKRDGGAFKKHCV